MTETTFTEISLQSAHTNQIEKSFDSIMQTQAQERIRRSVPNSDYFQNGNQVL